MNGTSRILLVLLGAASLVHGDDRKSPPKSFSPFTPGVQNQTQPQPAVGGQHRIQRGPFNPGTQNQSTNNNWNWGNSGGSRWNNGSNSPWNTQPQWHTQPPVRIVGPQPSIVYSGEPITIRMPDGQAGACSYVLGSGEFDWNYTIAPGQSQVFAEDRSWRITFDRGDGFGEQAYRLQPGEYSFRRGDRGWELYRAVTPPPASAAAPPPPT